MDKKNAPPDMPPRRENCVQAIRGQTSCRPHLLDPTFHCDFWERMMEFATVEEVFQTSIFMSIVRDDEWQSIPKAMVRESIGSGHWYTCANEHSFVVGECGRPLHETRCHRCNAPVGGRSHRAAEGVQRATELEERLTRMQM